MRRRNTETHAGCRSLLQKAARRGHADVAADVARHLASIGDRQWVNQRVPVIAFEECWPVMTTSSERWGFEPSLVLLDHLTKREKRKDAAGLGSLAFHISEGRSNASRYDDASGSAHEVATAFADADRFWADVRHRAPEESHGLVSNAERFFRRGGWPWDRAFMAATAFLAASEPPPPLGKAAPIDLPLWVALDRHTDEGKHAARVVAKELGVPVAQVEWAFFYWESAKCNASHESAWWTREMTWRLESAGLSIAESEELWAGARPRVEATLEEQTQEFEQHIESIRSGQLNLFSD